MRLSRPCYDKPHRCPGWAGGGVHFPSTRGYAKYGSCDNGSIRTRLRRGDESGDNYPGSRRWSFGRCTKCDVVTWPVVIRWVDPGWWNWKWIDFKIDLKIAWRRFRNR